MYGSGTIKKLFQQTGVSKNQTHGEGVEKK
jgi:hypothetical protein